MIFRTLFPRLILRRSRRVSPVLNLQILRDKSGYLLSWDACSFLEGKGVFMVSQSPPHTFFEYLLLFFFLSKGQGSGWDRYSLFFQFQGEVLELSLRKYREAPSRPWILSEAEALGDEFQDSWSFPLSEFPQRNLRIETGAVTLNLKWQLLTPHL